MNTSTISAGRPGHKKLLFKYSSQSAFRFRCILDDLMRDQHIKDYYDIYGEDLQDTEETSYFNNSNNDDLRSCITGFTAATGVTNKSQSHVSKIQIKNQPEPGYGIGYKVHREPVVAKDNTNFNDTQTFITTRTNATHATTKTIDEPLTFNNELLIFDVFLDGNLIYSKTNTGRFPLTVHILIKLGLIDEKILGGRGIADKYYRELDQKNYRKYNNTQRVH